MYMNKNKGSTLIELMVVLFIIAVIFQIIYVYLRYINLENKRTFTKIQHQVSSEILFKKIQNSLYESSTYKIYQFSNMPKVIDYSKESLEEGNMLLIEKYIPFEEETEIEIYFQGSANYIVSYYGVKNSENYIRKIERGEVVLKRIKTKFYLEEFGMSLEGLYFNKKYRKELKK